MNQDLKNAIVQFKPPAISEIERAGANPDIKRRLYAVALEMASISKMLIDEISPKQQAVDLKIDKPVKK